MGKTFKTLPVIQHEPGRLPENIDETINALIKSDLGIYRWAGGLYRIHRLSEDQSGPVYRPKNCLVLASIDGTQLLELSTAAAVHTKFDARAKDYKVTNCPRLVAEGILARQYWPEFPELSGVVESAFIDLDGREVSAPGYDAKTGIYVAVDKQLPHTAKRGHAAAKAGLEAIKDHLKSFPYVSDEDLSAAVAAIMTAPLRRVLSAAPMVSITAPTAGTGKTMLGEIVSIIASGKRPAVLSVGSDENEFAKRVYGELLAGVGFVMFDNINRPFGNEDVLNQLLSQPELRFRPLGMAGTISAPTNIMVVSTGNNLSIVGDAKRRTLLIRLDAQMERPEQRQFEGDILKETHNKRNALLRAALDITKGYLAASCPEINAKPYGSFADWDRMVRRPLIWLGEPDPLLAGEGLRDQDPDLECMRQVFTAWHDEYRHSEVMVSNVVNDGMETFDKVPRRPELYDALQVACSEKPNNRRFAAWLRNHKNRIVDGFMLTQSGKDGKTKISKWRIVEAP